MYLPFVMCGYAAALVLVWLGCWLISRAIPSLRGIRELAWAVLAAIAGVTLGGLRPWVPAFVAILLGNCALLASFVLVYWAAASVLRKGERFPVWAAALCVAVLPEFGYATWVHPDIVLRIWLSSGTIALLAGATAVLLFRHRSPAPAYSTQVLGSVNASIGLLNAARCVLSGLYPPVDFIHGDWIQSGFTYAQLVLCIASCSGIVWLSLCQNRAELEELALTDSLTGLLNRRAFDDILHREMQRSRRSGAVLGLILFDLDRFKQLNDTFGHGAGDEALRSISQVLKQAIRPADSLARYGGEEFVLLIRNAQLEETESIGERLREAIAQCAAASTRFRLTASVGIAMSLPNEHAAAFLDRCDRALYASKRSGRNQVTVYDAAPRIVEICTADEF